MSPLVEYLKKGLENCYMPDLRCWSAIHHLDGRENPNESQAPRDAFYSLNVILGLAALNKNDRPAQFDLTELLHENAQKLFEIPVPRYAKGMALWASGALDVPLPLPVAARIYRIISNRDNWNNFRAQDSAMLLTGMAMQKSRGNNDFDRDAHGLYDFIWDNHLAPSKLFYEQPKGFRRNFSSFASQAYMIAALYHYGTHFGRDAVLETADLSAKKMLALQGPGGEWPWFYFVPKGIPVDNYELYTVHQAGMAPLFLRFAEERGVVGAREAIVKSFRWILGNNQLQRNMLVPERGLFYRSIARDGELDDKSRRVARAVRNSMAGRPDSYLVKNLVLRPQCRSYELGWIMHSFGARNDMREITHHQDFVDGSFVEGKLLRAV